jgi:hypothetical protein
LKKTRYYEAMANLWYLPNWIHMIVWNNKGSMKWLKTK